MTKAHIILNYYRKASISLMSSNKISYEQICERERHTLTTKARSKFTISPKAIALLDTHTMIARSEVKHYDLCHDKAHIS